MSGLIFHDTDSNEEHMDQILMERQREKAEEKFDAALQSFQMLASFVDDWERSRGNSREQLSAMHDHAEKIGKELTNGTYIYTKKEQP